MDVRTADRAHYAPAGMKYAFIVLLALLLLCSLESYAQAPVELRRADVLRTETGPNGIIRYLDGDVWIVQDTLSVTCEHAKYEEQLGRLFSEVDVHFIEPSRQIWADQAIYYERDGRAIAEGNVRIEQDSVLIFCDRVVYNEARAEALFYGDVQIFSLPDRTVISGNHGAYSRAREHGVITQDPRLVRQFEGGDSLVIVGVIIEYFFSNKHAIVTDSVQIQRSEFNAWGDKLFYWDDQERARLIGNPRIKHNRDVLTADTVDAYFAENKLDRVLLSGRAAAASPVDSIAPLPENRMTGHRMEITFFDDEVDSIHVQGNATSLYYVREEGDNKGANRVSGDLIDIWMNQGRIAWIYVEGGTEGVYYPEKMEDRAEEDERKGFMPEQGF